MSIEFVHSNLTLIFQFYFFNNSPSEANSKNLYGGINRLKTCLEWLRFLGT